MLLLLLIAVYRILLPKVTRSLIWRRKFKSSIINNKYQASMQIIHRSKLIPHSEMTLNSRLQRVPTSSITSCQWRLAADQAWCKEWTSWLLMMIKKWEDLLLRRVTRLCSNIQLLIIRDINFYWAAVVHTLILKSKISWRVETRTSLSSE